MGLKIRKGGAWVNIDPEDSGVIKAYANGAISAGDPVVLNSDGTVSKVSAGWETPSVFSAPTNPYNGSNSQYNSSEWTNTNSNITSISVVCIGGGGGRGGPEDLYAGGGAGLGTATINVSLNDVFEIQTGAGGTGGYNREVEDGSIVNQIGYDGGDSWVKRTGTIIAMGQGGEGGSETTSGEGGGYSGDGGGAGGDGGYQGYTAVYDCAPGGGGAGGYTGKGGDGGNSPYSGNETGRDGEDAASGSGGGGGGGANDFGNVGENGAGAGGGGTYDGGKGADGEGGACGDESNGAGGFGGEGGSWDSGDGQDGGLRGTSPYYTGVNQGGHGGLYGGGGGKAEGNTSEGESVNGGYGGRGVVRITPYATNLKENTYIGFSESSYASNDTARINIIGSIDTNQSGLTVGEKYYIQVDGTLSTTAGDPKVEAGIALNSTTLLISGGALLGTGDPPPFTTQGWDIE